MTKIVSEYMCIYNTTQTWKLATALCPLIVAVTIKLTSQVTIQFIEKKKILCQTTLRSNSRLVRSCAAQYFRALCSSVM